MSIIDRIIKFLGAFTYKEYFQLNLEYSNQRDLVNLYRARVDALEKELQSQKEESKFLQNLIFEKFGIVTNKEQLFSQDENLKPIATSPQRWSSLRTRLENDDRDRVRGHSEEKAS